MGCLVREKGVVWTKCCYLNRDHANLMFYVIRRGREHILFILECTIEKELGRNI
jgi:hypothetical protein